ncbi:phosphoribosylamine--glycine ligase [bacterium]|nr:MAG: phosphoribosylamine--glycine ligase [bacterium]
MNVMIVGKGGREHALAWKISKSPYLDELVVAPGNAGIEQIANTMDISQDDIRGLANYAEHNSIDLTIVGPEDPLANGITDYFSRRGLAVFGPSESAARIEASKVFAKDFMKRFHIPTAGFLTFDNAEGAIRFVEEHDFPIVIKTDGLAGGKGSVVAKNIEEARDAIVHMMIERTWGDAGKTVVVEEFLQGTEISVLAMTDGDNAIILPPAQDYKRAYDGNNGPNTGGMGCIAPHPMFDLELRKITMDEIIIPAIEGLKFMDSPFKGILYAGLMITSSGPKVLEFNCRFGDPETQAILPLMESDLLEMMLFALENRILEADCQFSDKKSVCVVIASGGYPKRYKKGYPIEGLGEISTTSEENVLVFHAGTAQKGDSIISDGGRVLNVVGLGDDFSKAINNAYSMAGKIKFEKSFYRKDIGAKYKNA